MKDLSLLSIIVYVIGPIVISMGAYFVKNVIARLDELEEKYNSTITKNEMRQVLEDKIEPLRDDIQELKVSINKIFDRLIK